MPRPSISVVVPAFDEEAIIAATLARIAEYFEGTGLSYEIVVVDDGSTDATASIVAGAAGPNPAIRLLSNPGNAGKGAAVRRGMLDAQGDVVAFVDADFPYLAQNLGDAVALVQSGAADLAVGSRDLRAVRREPSQSLSRGVLGRLLSLAVRAFFVRRVSDAQCGLKAFSASAAAALFGESRLSGFAFDVEILYLADKYGFRIEKIPVAPQPSHKRLRVVRESWRMAGDLLRVWKNDRRGLYRPPRRCPVCFSAEVWSRAQIGGQVARVCERCKCRFFSPFASHDDDEPPRLPESWGSAFAATDLQDLTPTERRTFGMRLKTLRGHLPPGSRVLEIGAGSGRLGSMLAREFEYVGIELSDESCRQARARGIEVYRSRLSSFVNTGPQFDAVTMFRVLEKLEDPHDALGKINELLRPGGLAVIVTPDTESLLCLLSRDRWFAYDEPDSAIFYSRAGLIELLERSGFEILAASAEFEFAGREEILARVGRIGKIWGLGSKALVYALPTPFPASLGCIRVVARRRGAGPYATRTIRSVEPTHAR